MEVELVSVSPVSATLTHGRKLEPESLEVEESSLEPHAARTIEMPATAAVTARVFMFFTKVLRLLG